MLKSRWRFSMIRSSRTFERQYPSIARRCRCNRAVTVCLPYNQHNHSLRCTGIGRAHAETVRITIYAVTFVVAFVVIDFTLERVATANPRPTSSQSGVEYLWITGCSETTSFYYIGFPFMVVWTSKWSGWELGNSPQEIKYKKTKQTVLRTHTHIHILTDTRTLSSAVVSKLFFLHSFIHLFLFSVPQGALIQANPSSLDKLVLLLALLI
jgi:hypothetical protein